MKLKQQGFTLVEIAIVLLIVTILLGYTVAMFPRQQELKQFRAADAQMDEVVAAIVGFAQVNGRLPCPAIPASAGVEDFNTTLADGCNSYGGFVPVNTLGIAGRLNEDSLLLDPWGNPYRYYVSDVDFDGDTFSDFASPGEMRDIGLVDSDTDNYIDLDGQLMICDAAGSSNDDQCTGAVEVFGTYDAGPPVVYAGAPFVLLSQGKNWNDGTTVGDELENQGTTSLAGGPASITYPIKNIGTGQTTFVRPPGGFSDNFDDLVKWVSPNILYSKMIDAGQLP
ncbi:MAG: prepilin-type N-terminal cleavage/methylation domain-containing protein [Gammaproteobacteria bacterium]|jgi:prepilin-type N-terminal cleavage/methylation domain-containing protein